MRSERREREKKIGKYVVLSAPRNRIESHEDGSIFFSRWLIFYKWDSDVIFDLMPLGNLAYKWHGKGKCARKAHIDLT